MHSATLGLNFDDILHTQVGRERPNYQVPTVDAFLLRGGPSWREDFVDVGGEYAWQASWDLRVMVAALDASFVLHIEKVDHRLGIQVIELHLIKDVPWPSHVPSC